MDHLTHEQMSALLQVAHQHSERDYIMILLAYKHGLRASEVCSLKVSNFDQSSAIVYITVQRLKGSERSTHPLCPEEVAAAQKWIAGKERNSYLFPGKHPNTHLSRFMFWRFFKMYCHETGVIAEHLSHPHVVKHSTAMHAIQQAGIENTRKFLGHRNLASTARYLRADDATAAAAVMGTLA